MTGANLIIESWVGKALSELQITLPDGRRLRHAIGPTPQTIGREGSCEIAIDDPSASRRHARFSVTQHGVLLEDLGSKNGTLLNDQPCTSKLLRDGDQIQVGASFVVFHESTPSSPGSVVIADDLTQSHSTHYIAREKHLLLSHQRLQMIYELTERLTTLQSQDQLLANAMDIGFETLSFERGAVGVRRRNSRVLDWPVVRHLRGAGGELAISGTLLRRALEHGERAIFTEGDRSTSDPTMSIVQHGIRSAMCVPLIHKDEILGIMYGDRITTSTSYTGEDIDFFAGIAQQVSVGLINVRLVEDQQQMIRLNHDLDLARTIQTGLFPRSLPQRPDLKVAALNDPGQRVSGDYYDVIENDDGRVWMLIADVTGEGIASAMLMANLQAAVRVTIAESDDPAVLLSKWNRLIWRNTDRSKFVTCLVALIDPKARMLHLASAGHFLPVALRGAVTIPEELSAESDIPLGIMEEVAYKTTSIEIGAEPVLFFCYTDGVVEAMSPESQTFGRERLMAALQESTELNPAALIKHVRKQVAAFAGAAGQSDDITMLAVRIE